MHMTSKVSKLLLQGISGLFASSAVLLSGFSGLTGTAPATVSFGSPASITGTVHGGQQPVFNSTVRLYSAGTSGYGTGSTLLATSLPTDASGSFLFAKA